MWAVKMNKGCDTFWKLTTLCLFSLYQFSSLPPAHSVCVYLCECEQTQWERASAIIHLGGEKRLFSLRALCMLLFAVFNTKGTTVNNNFNDVWLYLVCLYFFLILRKGLKVGWFKKLVQINNFLVLDWTWFLPHRCLLAQIIFHQIKRNVAIIKNYPRTALFIVQHFF